MKKILIILITISIILTCHFLTKAQNKSLYRDYIKSNDSAEVSGRLKVMVNDGIEALYILQTGTGNGVTLVDSGNGQGIFVTETNNGNGIRVDESDAGAGILINSDDTGLVVNTGLTSFHDFVYYDSVYHVFGGFQDSTVAVGGTQNTWYQITNATYTLWGGSESVGFSLSNDTMTKEISGDVCGIASITFLGSNQQEYIFRLYNATQTRQEGFHQGMTGAGASNYVQVTIPIYMEGNANDEYTLEFNNISGNNVAAFKHAQFLLLYLHD